jgi:hypothetical protein
MVFGIKRYIKYTIYTLSEQNCLIGYSQSRNFTSVFKRKLALHPDNACQGKKYFEA